MNTIKPRNLQRYLLWVACVICSFPALAGELQDIQFSSLQGGRFEARLVFDSVPPEPKGYTIEEPARIALDLPGVNSALQQKKFPLSYGNANSAVVLESGGRTRLVLNLVELVPYQTRVEGNQLIVEVGGASKEYLEESEDALQQVASEQGVSSASGNSITDMDFKRGPDGAGMLVLGLGNPKTDINVYEQGSKIFVELANVSLPANLQRRYDVSDFATPVQSVDALTDTKGARFELKSTGDYDYLAYQADNQYVVSVKPLTAQEVEDRRKEFQFVGEKLSLNFQNIEVRAVLQLIADFTELNLVASDTVQGNITLRLKNVPWDQALELVLKTKGLDKRLVGNVLMVAPAAEIAERERKEIEAQKTVRELAPLRSEFIRIRYADAADLLNLFSRKSSGSGGDEGEDILSERGSVVLEERTNSLLVTETAEKLDEIRSLIKQIDVPIRQVQIEARIVRASSDFGKSLGVRWGGAYTKVNSDSIYSANGSIEENNETTSNLIDAAVNGDPSFEVVPGMVADLGVAGAAGSFALGYIGSDVFLNLELSALESKGDGEVVSQPKVITGDKEQATIKAGTEIPYPQSSSNGETTIAFKEAVLSLEVTPIITPDDRVLLDLVINQDAVGQLVIPTGQGGQVPTIDTTSLETKVLVGNGETVVLGGVYEAEDLKSVTKVPFLGDLPYIGRFFKRTAVSQGKSEMLIFITPRILADTLVQ